MQRKNLREHILWFFLQYFQRAHTESLRSPIRTGNVSQYFTKLKSAIRSFKHAATLSDKIE